MRSFQRSPLRRTMSLRPADRSEDLLKRLPTSSRGAVHAVSHDFDGFVRRRQCGLVASHYRPWSSPGFRPTDDVSAASRPFPLALNPSECFPPDKVGAVTVPLLGRSPDAMPLSWLALLPSCSPAETGPLFERHLHLRGVQIRSPLLASRVATAGSPDTPLGFPRLRAFTRRSAGDDACRSTHPPVQSPTETGFLQTRHPPKRISGTDDLVALEPSHPRSHSRSRSCVDAGSRDRSHGFPCAPPMPKHCSGAAAFQGPPLPMSAVTCRDELPVSVGALAEASRRAEAFRHRVSSLTFP